MTRRPAVTLMEVLIAMFIMAIGMLALLALFPVGAVSMAQALKDDRCSTTAIMAENVAIAQDIRHDASVTGTFQNSSLVYVDPHGAQSVVGNLGGFIPRVTPSFVAGSSQLADRWFSLPDDIGFGMSGTPDVSSNFIDRGRRYSYAYLLRQLHVAPSNLTPTTMVQLMVVVYAGRPINSLSALQNYEWSYSIAAVSPPNGIQLNTTTTTAKRGGWILDSTGNFYRIANIVENGGGVVLETQQNLQPTVAIGQNIVIMDFVVEVFDKGTSWQP